LVTLGVAQGPEPRTPAFFDRARLRPAWSQSIPPPPRPPNLARRTQRWKPGDL